MGPYIMIMFELKAKLKRTNNTNVSWSTLEVAVLKFEQMEKSTELKAHLCW